MILFCDFNPKIIREYKLDSETENIIENSKIYPSGKGLYMSLFAKKLGVDSEVFMLKGGSRGREIALSLSRLGIDVNYTALKDENVEEVIIRGEETLKDYRTQDPRITMEDRNDILNSFERALYNKKIAVIPKINLFGIEDDIYEKLIKICYKNNLKVAVNPKNLDTMEKTNPYILIFDKDDIEKKRKINYTGEVIEFNKKFIQAGSKIVFVNSKRATIISTEDKNYRAYVNKKKLERNEITEKFDTELSLAGLAMAIDRDYDFITSIKLAISCGVWENFVEKDKIDMSAIKKIMNSVEVEEI
ncbi:PfkB family carbohydrate kinase [uncultured Peptoniphilus sp.]|uniref:PfkB family carbohydrate kinase n=1 Tax=uncultured Peptoniphilus sp. TaxID=254354 RepID=UPI002590B67F|nr:PfkB family carbohydrate kinase [uncultured Peptoniphilus sp.]MDU6784188.1 tagatose-6-phosphate kinase [Peptoniphilus harei]